MAGTVAGGACASFEFPGWRYMTDDEHVRLWLFDA